MPVTNQEWIDATVSGIKDRWITISNREDGVIERKTPSCQLCSLSVQEAQKIYSTYPSVVSEAERCSICPLPKFSPKEQCVGSDFYNSTFSLWSRTPPGKMKQDYAKDMIIVLSNLLQWLKTTGFGSDNQDEDQVVNKEIEIVRDDQFKELKAQWEEDKKLFKEPWKVWQFKSIHRYDGDWYRCVLSGPEWNDTSIYRRSPQYQQLLRYEEDSKILEEPWRMWEFSDEGSVEKWFPCHSQTILHKPGRSLRRKLCHIHYYNMKLFALDAEKSPEPWKNWKVRRVGESEWNDLTPGPHWLGNYQYFIKKQT